MRKLLYITCIIFLSYEICFAQTNVNVDLTKLDPDVRNVILNSLKKDNNSEAIVSYQKYAEIGKSIAIALGEAAKQLNVEMNAFSTTSVGKITIYLIIYKLIGKDIIRLFILLGIIVLLIFSFRNFFIKKKIKEGSEIKYVERYDFVSRDAKGFCAVTHIILFLAIIIAISVI